MRSKLVQLKNFEIRNKRPKIPQNTKFEEKILIPKSYNVPDITFNFENIRLHIYGIV